MSDSMEHMTDPQTEYYIVPKSVYDDALLSPSARLLYGAIMYAARNPENRGWRTNASYAEQFSKHERSVTTWVSELEAAGYISIDTVLRSNSNQVYRRYITPNVIMGQVDSRIKRQKDNQGGKKHPKHLEENYGGKNNIKKNNTIGDESPKEVIKAKPKKKVRPNHPDHYVEGTVEKVSMGFKYFDFKPPTQEEVYNFYKKYGEGLNRKILADDYIAKCEFNNWTCNGDKDKIHVWPLHLNRWIKQGLVFESKRGR